MNNKRLFNQIKSKVAYSPIKIRQLCIQVGLVFRPTPY